MKSTSSIRTWAHSWAVALGFLIVSDAQAVLISVDDPAFRFGGAITRDTVNHLEWLDLNYSWEYSVDEILSELGPGGTFAGFRYATSSEIVSLWAEAGFPAHPDQPNSPYWGAVNGLIDLIGQGFFDSDAARFSFGRYDGGAPGSSWASFYATRPGSGRFSSASLGSQPPPYEAPHFLVRSVPDSGATIGLLGLAFAGLAATRRFVRC